MFASFVGSIPATNSIFFSSSSMVGPVGPAEEGVDTFPSGVPKDCDMLVAVMGTICGAEEGPG